MPPLNTWTASPPCFTPSPAEAVPQQTQWHARECREHVSTERDESGSGGGSCIHLAFPHLTEVLSAWTWFSGEAPPDFRLLKRDWGRLICNTQNHLTSPGRGDCQVGEPREGRRELRALWWFALSLITWAVGLVTWFSRCQIFIYKMSS